MSLLSDVITAARAGSASRTSLGGLGWSLMMAGVSADNWALVAAGALVTAVPYVWGWMRHSNAERARSAADIKGVTIAVNPSVAPQSVIDLAHDRNEPDIKAGFVQTLR